jgi:pimeloyl-ACP methyl ester carboxylesterase
VLLGSPSALAGNPTVEAAWEQTVSRLTDPVPLEFVTALVDSCTASPLPPDVRELLVAESLSVPAHVWTQTLRGLLDDDTVGRLGQIACPTEIHWGDADTVLDRADEELLASLIPGSRLVVHEGVGHAVYWEAGEQVAQALASFAASTDAGRDDGIPRGAASPR